MANRTYDDQRNRPISFYYDLWTNRKQEERKQGRIGTWSFVLQKFSRKREPCYVHTVGESGYPAEPWLLTPLTTPTTPSEHAYNASHARTRNVIERCFGVMKSRFRCLDNSGGTLLYSPERACRIVTAVSVLHNFCITRNITTTLDAGVAARCAAIQPATVPAACQQNTTSAAVRRRVIQQYFWMSRCFVPSFNDSQMWQMTKSGRQLYYLVKRMKVNRKTNSLHFVYATKISQAC